MPIDLVKPVLQALGRAEATAEPGGSENGALETSEPRALEPGAPTPRTASEPEKAPERTST